MALKIRGSGFFFGIPVDSPRASFEEFFKWIKGIGPGSQWPFRPNANGNGDIKREMYCDFDDTHFFGIFLSARNANFQHFVKREGNKVIVEAQSTGGHPPVDMNFFCIRRDSNKGIFSHYEGSYRFSRFLFDLWATYHHFVTKTKDDHLANLSDGESKKSVCLSYSLKNRKQVAPLFTPGSFDTIMRNIDTIDEIRLTSYAVDNPADQPVSTNIKSVHKAYRFTDGTKRTNIWDWLCRVRELTTRALNSGKTVHSGSVIGRTNSGIELCIDFDSTMEDHLKYDYDSLGTFEVDAINRHELVQSMRQQTIDKHLFMPTEE